MQVPLQIVFRECDRTDLLETQIRERVAKLERFFPRLTSCRVTIGMIQRSKHQGKLFNVRVDVTLPGHEILVNRDRSDDLHVALRDAFDHTRRKIEDLARRMQGQIKQHEIEQHGKVVEIYPEEGFGFIEKIDGAHVYFHRFNLQRPDFEHLHEGDRVVFLEENAKQGSQANRVRRIGPDESARAGIDLKKS